MRKNLNERLVARRKIAIIEFGATKQCTGLLPPCDKKVKYTVARGKIKLEVQPVGFKW